MRPSGVDWHTWNLLENLCNFTDYTRNHWQSLELLQEFMGSIYSCSFLRVPRGSSKVFVYFQVYFYLRKKSCCFKSGFYCCPEMEYGMEKISRISKLLSSIQRIWKELQPLTSKNKPTPLKIIWIHTIAWCVEQPEIENNRSHSLTMHMHKFVYKISIHFQEQNMTHP